MRGLVSQAAIPAANLAGWSEDTNTQFEPRKDPHRHSEPNRQHCPRRRLRHRQHRPDQCGHTGPNRRAVQRVLFQRVPIALFDATDTLNVIGVIGQAPAGTGWTVPNGSTMNNTLVRQHNTSQGGRWNGPNGSRT